MKILVASKNSAKMEGAKQAFELYFDKVEVEGIDVLSRVADQPIDKDICMGAKNRVNNLISFAKERRLHADYFVSIESGMTNLLGNWIIVNVAFIVDKYGKVSWGTSQGFPVPDKYVNLIKQQGLGKVMDDIFNEHNIRKDKGGINFLTNGKITRVDISRDAFIMALTQFVNEYWN